MTTGAVAGTVLLVAWSQVQTLWELYPVFAGLGAATAMALYDAAGRPGLRGQTRSRITTTGQLAAGVPPSWGCAAQPSASIRRAAASGSSASWAVGPMP
jgi:hypothetical protein